MSEGPSSKQGGAAPAALLQEEGSGGRQIDHVNIRNEPPAGVSDPPAGTGGNVDEHEGHHEHRHNDQQDSTLSSDQGQGQNITDFAGGQGQREGLAQGPTVPSDRGQGVGQDTTTDSSNLGPGQTQGQGLGEGLGQDQARDREPSHYQAAPGVPATGRKDLIKVPVHVDSHLAELSDEEVQDDKGGPLKKVAGALGKVKKLRGDKSTAIGKVITLEMTREDYNKYWIKDEQGNYAGTEPEGEGRRLWANELKAAKGI